MLSFLALGDSYTVGEGVPEAGRWPVQLAAALRARGIALDDPRIVATTGWTTDELAAAMDDAGLAPVDAVFGRRADAADGAPPGGATYDLVSLLIGVNNQYRGRPLAEYRDQFTVLLRRAIHLAGGRADRVIVLAIPDWGVTPFAASSGRDPAQIARALDAFNAAAAEIAGVYGVAFVDIAPVSRAKGAELVAADGLHPSAALYGEWVGVALPVVERMLGR